MPCLLVLLAIVIAVVVEFWFLKTLAGSIGWLGALGVLVGSCAIGCAIVGWRKRRLDQQMNFNPLLNAKAAQEQLGERLGLTLSLVFFLAPGLISDVVGWALLSRWCRRVLGTRLVQWASRQVAASGFSFHLERFGASMGEGRADGRVDGKTVQGEFVDDKGETSKED